MQWVMMDTNEWESARFQRLSDAIGVDGDNLQDRYRAMGHLAMWYQRWGRDRDMDTGILWGVTERLMGVWAGWDAPLKFGRGLVSAGYCEPVAQVYPPELVRGREGLVVIGALEASWGAHAKRAGACDLVLYLPDPLRRAERSAALGVSARALEAEKKIPVGWLSGRWPVVGGEEAGSFPGSGPDPAGSREGAVPAPPAVSVPPAPPSGTLRSGKEGMNQRHVTGGTGRRPTGEMLESIRDLKYSDPLKCLCLLDDGPRARRLWVNAVEKNRDGVCTILAEMTETDEVWAGWSNPASVATTAIKRKLRVQ